ncbi:MAG: zeta toxin family protein [Acidobacteriota bacterium]|nr:zeta toxin family protein [Acidobacteriota bacterium]
MNEAQPQVVIIAGPNGAGKSTLAPFLLRDALDLREYVNADPIALGLSGFDPASVAFKAGRVMMNRLHYLAEQRKSFAFETTLATRFYAGWIEKLRRQGYNFQLIFLLLQTPELAVRRVRERVQSGGHDVPEAVVIRRYARGLDNFRLIYQPLADVWSVYDNSSSSEPTLIALGGRDRALQVLESDAWTRFSEINR